LAGDIDDVRVRINIVDLVSQRVQLKKTGKNYQGLCPFHEDKRPSFSVNPLLGRYRCWSCGEHGDIFTWVMKTQGLDFPEALDMLAKQAGVELAKTPGVKRDKTEKALQLEIMEEALNFFRDQLTKSSTGQEYLASRSIDAAAVKEWELGYAPNVGEALAIHLQKKGYPLAVCRTLFLVEEDSSGGYFDKFRGRLMFPIRDERGELVAFGGRILGDGHPKYINSSDTPLYRKGRVLYGMNIAVTAIAKSKPRRAVLCEGYLDVIACHRAGVKGGVASLGTALSEDHAKMLGRWCDEVVILYDADGPGQKAAERAIEILKPTKLQIRVALMPSGDDPDTLLRKQGPAAVEAAVENATQPTEFKIDQLIAAHPEKNQTFWNLVVETLVEAPSIMEIERHVERLVSRFAGVEDQLYIRESVRRQVIQRRKAQRRPTGATIAPANVFAVAELQPAEATLIAALATMGLRRIAHEALVLPELFISAAGRAFSVAFQEAFGENPPTGEPSVWMSHLPEDMQDLVAQCESDGRFSNLSDRFVKDAIDKLVRALEKRKLQLLKQHDDPDRIAKIENTLRRIKNR